MPRSKKSDTRTAETREREEYWRAVFKRQAESGLSQADFCRREDIPSSRYYWWKRQLRVRAGKEKRAPKPERQRKGQRKDSQESDPQLVRVRVRSTPAIAAPIEIVLQGGRSIRVPEGFDEEQLKRLTLTLESIGAR